MSQKTTKNIVDVIAGRASQAVAIYHQNGSLTYKELHQLIDKCVTLLKQNDVQPKDVVAVILRDELLQIIMMLAVAKIGGTLFCLPAETHPQERTDLLQKVETSYLFSDIVNIDHNIIYADLEMINATHPTNSNSYQETSTLPWIIVFGSGSTGKSKLIPITHEQQIERMKLSFSTFELDQNDRFASLIHINFYSSRFLCLSALYSGIPIVIFDRQDIDILQQYNSFNVTLIYATVAHIHRFLKQTDRKMSGLKALLVAGSFVSSSLRKEVAQKLTKQLFIGYGTNESGSITRSVPPKSYLHERSVGYPLSGVTVEIVDKDDLIVPSESIGEIRIRGKSVICGYIGDNDATRASFKDEWFYPGDLGAKKDDGEILFYGRSDDMMIMNGINIYPVEIENTMLTHPDIVDAAALPVESLMSQDIPICAVTLSKQSKVSQNELLIYCKKRLGSRAPQKIIILDTIPRNEQGKKMRKEINAIVKEKLTKKNIVDFITNQAQSAPHNLAIIDNGDAISYKLLDELINRCATSLHNSGIKEGDIAINVFNSDMLFAITMLALAKLGATLVSLSNDVSDDYIEQIAHDTNVTFILSDQKSRKIKKLSFIAVTKDSIDNSDIDNSIFSPSPASPWQITIGSGSTGKKKLMAISHAQEMRNALTSIDSFPLYQNDRVGSFINISFSDTKRRFFETMAVGATFVFFDLNRLNLRTILHDYKITFLRSSIFHIERLLKQIKREKRKVLDSLRVLSLGNRFCKR